MNKKLVLGLALLSAPFLLTGCGNSSKKTMTCTATESDSGVTGDIVATVVYEGDTMKSGDVKYTFDFSGLVTDDSQYDLLKQQNYCNPMVTQMKASSADLADGLGECNEKWDGKTLYVTIQLKADELSKKDNFKGIENAKKEFEAGDTMKCEIK